MAVRLEPFSSEVREPVIDIYNHYIRHGFEAYREKPVDYGYFDILVALTEGHPAAVARAEDGTVLGFGLLRPYDPAPAFVRTAKITYFLHPDALRRGIGTLLLGHFLQAAAARGVRVILAGVSSLNEGSLAFHRRHGFVECGRFREIGEKRGRIFDVVWLQRAV